MNLVCELTVYQKFLYQQHLWHWERTCAGILKCLIISFVLFSLLSRIPSGSCNAYVIIYVPLHDKTNKMTCTPSVDSDQPGHLPTLISVSLCTQRIDKDPRYLHAESEGSDQTGWMAKLIRVFAGRTCHFVGFVMLQLNYLFSRIQRK